MITLPQEVRSLVTGAAGVCRVIADLSWPGPGRHRVWELEAGAPGSGVRLIVKQHVATTAFGREFAAYRTLVPALGADRVPHLVAASERECVLVPTSLPGTPVCSQSLDAEEECEVFRQAGALLAALHAKPPPAPQPGRLTWREHVTQVQPELQGLPDTSAALLGSLLAGGPPPRLALAAVHGDWMPRNWLWDGLRLRIVDFEATTSSAGCTDVARLGYRILRRRPDLDTAFRRGYGRHFTRTEHEAMRRYAALDALQALRWGRTYQDEATLTQAHTMIEQLHADQSKLWEEQHLSLPTSGRTGSPRSSRTEGRW